MLTPNQLFLPPNAAPYVIRLFSPSWCSLLYISIYEQQQQQGS